jgi:hypothetical protein
MLNSTTIAPTNVFLQKDFLSRLLPLHVAKKWVKQIALPAKNSSTVEVARIERIAPLTGASAATVKSYVEGQTPGDTSFTLTKVQLTTALYAHLIRTTDQVDLLNERQILNELMKLNSENLADVVELIIDSPAGKYLVTPKIKKFFAGNNPVCDICEKDIPRCDYISMAGPQLCRQCILGK